MQSLRRSSKLCTFHGAPLVLKKRNFAIRATKEAAPVAVGRPKKDSRKGDSEKLIDKTEAWKKIADDINKKYGKGTMFKLTDKPIKVPTFSTGLMSLDMILGGGIPKGRIIEVFGPEASGKTTLAWHLLAEAQKPDNAVVYVDAECATDPQYARRIGVDDDRLMMISPSSGDEALDIIIETMRSRRFSAICVDSVAALTPADEQEVSLEDHRIAPQARLMSRGMRNVNQANANSGVDESCTVVFVNQLRTKVGAVIYGNPETRPGGRALPYAATQILDIRGGKKILDPAGNAIGHHIKIKTVKNKIAVPYKTVELDLIYGEGICSVGSLLNAAVEMKVIKQSGTYYSFEEKRLGHGRPKTIETLKQDAKLKQKVEEMTRAEFERRSELREDVGTKTESVDDELLVYQDGNGVESDPSAEELDDAFV